MPFNKLGLKPPDKDGRNMARILQSPVWTLIVIAFSIFISETIVMAILSFLPPISSQWSEALLDSTFLLILLSPMLYYLVFRPLLLHLKEYRETEQALHKVKEELEYKVVERTSEFQKANEQLTVWAKELEQYNHENKLLSQMVDYLQICVTSGEAYATITKMLVQLFPADSGALFIFKASRNFLEVMAVWGDAPPKAQMFMPDECWALRRGQPHTVENISLDMQCQHAQDETFTGYLCMPMMAHGETLGILHLRIGKYSAVQNAKQYLDAKQRLLSNVGERIALALSNLKLRETLRSLSIRDPLTGLFNRRYMEEFLEIELSRAERKKTPIGVIMIDVDHFKRFNDTFGHKAGDIVLQELGVLMQRHIRKSDIPCRYGGEEFILILPEASLEITAQRAERLRESAKSLQLTHEQQSLGPISISLGVAIFPDNGLTGGSVVKAADAALYTAKQAGRDRVCVAGTVSSV
ncbi:MAG: diguanylate cyclase [Deltaproteobacteria bacterium]|nr:diguanylate cyclase [Deltaproteobacteria bacterium]